MEIFCRNLLSSGLDFELFSPTKLSQEEASTKVRCAPPPPFQSIIEVQRGMGILPRDDFRLM
jgi:hypothetical protein